MFYNRFNRKDYRNDYEGKTSKRLCPYCGSDVFYYEKKHESGRTSKVFFDALGKPWPLHRCREYLNRQRGNG